MSFHAGRPLRLELYGLALAGSVVAVLLWDRSRLQEELLKEVLRQLPQRMVIQQNNNQAVIIEAESDRLAREIAIKRGWIDVDGTNANANGTSARGGKLPTNQQ
jgi:hypothetical protein